MRIQEPKLMKLLNNEYFQIITGIIIGILLIIVFFNNDTVFQIITIIGLLLLISSIIRLIDIARGKSTDLQKLYKQMVLGPILLSSFLGLGIVGFKQLGKTINGS